MRSLRSLSSSFSLCLSLAKSKLSASSAASASVALMASMMSAFVLFLTPSTPSSSQIRIRSALPNELRFMIALNVGSVTILTASLKPTPQNSVNHPLRLTKQLIVAKAWCVSRTKAEHSPTCVIIGSWSPGRVLIRVVQHPSAAIQLLGVDAQPRLPGSMVISLASNLSLEQRPNQSVGKT
ncbi:unnamed protein product [Ixodes persulcatus]